MSNLLENDDMKKKLDSIWNEVQTSLPEIDFECDLRSDDFELVERSGEFNFEDLDDFDDVDGAETWTDFEKNFERLLCKDSEQLEPVSKSMVDIQLTESEGDSTDGRTAAAADEFKTFQSTFTSSAKASKQCVTSAQKMAKNMFDLGASKLNMDLFNTINFDDMLANLTTASSGSPSLDSTRSDEQNLYLRGVGTSSASTRLKDEAILAKLAVMNKSWFKKNTDEATDVFNVDSRPGSAIATTRCSSYTNKGLSPSHQKGTSSPSALDMLESQLTSNTQSGLKSCSLDMVEQQLTANTQEQMKHDLNKLLDSYSIKDGNLVETRRLDLRTAQNPTSHQRQRQRQSTCAATSTNPVEAFLSMRIDRALKPQNADPNKRPKIKFLNDNDSDSTSSSDEDEDEDEEGDCDRQLFGIELYRQQKMNALKIKQAHS